ncbi:hypothetical protein AG4045_016230 [Apium graveolens]|uniref:Pollen Ole e 1 allergen and extensin family protein n=1 Tax=Apium graveolens TaxID=4045 RepID=A0A6L5BCV6_APIGR|nr:hypothetical protein AG4045_016230 [Apium graveolens]
MLRGKWRDKWHCPRSWESPKVSRRASTEQGDEDITTVTAQSGYRFVYAVLGNIYCTINGSTGASGAATPVFPGALVQLVCVNSTSPTLTATTKADGTFTIQTYNPIPSDCKVVVVTPLSTCNSSLPATGGLVSSLRTVGSIVLRTDKHFLYTPEGFSYVLDLPS